MIDIHCHIIPNIDDGAKVVTETFKMASVANSLGYKSIFATPHYIENSHETNKSDIQNSVSVLNKLFNEKGIDLKLYVGNEVYFTPNIINLLEDKRMCTLGNSRYVLIEFPLNGIALNMENVINSVLNYGYIPIIAHPERYEFVHKDLKKLQEMVSQGALLQINVGSIEGFYGKYAKKSVIKLLKNDMVTFIGTDSHNYTSIYDIYKDAINDIKKVIKDNKLHEILIENPKMIESDINSII